MAVNHLLSRPLYDELFRHNLINCDGRIIANDEQLKNYSKFLLEQSRNGTMKELKDRKCVVDEVQRRLKSRKRSPISEKELKSSLNRLGLRLTKEDIIALDKEPEHFKMRLGPSYPELSLWERKKATYERSRKIQKRDLKMVDDWMKKNFNAKVPKLPRKTASEWKEEEFKYRAKVEEVLSKMAQSRRKLIEKQRIDVQEKWIHVVNRILEKIALSKALTLPDSFKELHAHDDEQDSEDAGKRTQDIPYIDDVEDFDRNGEVHDGGTSEENKSPPLPEEKDLNATSAEALETPDLPSDKNLSQTDVSQESIADTESGSKITIDYEKQTATYKAAQKLEEN